jgi:hypothetical protein
VLGPIAWGGEGAVEAVEAVEAVSEGGRSDLIPVIRYLLDLAYVAR